jgi:hypothetical protein
MRSGCFAEINDPALFRWGGLLSLICDLDTIGTQISEPEIYCPKSTNSFPLTLFYHQTENRSWLPRFTTTMTPTCRCSRTK